jgi:hypothetical protein
MDADIRTFARRWHIPLVDAQRFAAAIGRRCGEIASTLEHEGLSDTETLALAEAVGAQIAEAIALEFPDPGADGPAPERGPGGIGIGGPSKL